MFNLHFQTELQGLTGTIRFDNQGFRTDYSLDIVELSPKNETTQTIGNVDQSTFNLSRIEIAKEEKRKELETVQNKTFRVMIAVVCFMAKLSLSKGLDLSSSVYLTTSLGTMCVHCLFFFNSSRSHTSCFKSLQPS